MLKKLIKVYTLVIISTFTTPDVTAQSANALAQDRLQSQVEDYVNEQVNPDNSDNVVVNALPLDSRIRIATCPEPVNFEIASRRSFSRQFPVKVSCESESKNWKLFVQVRVTEYIEALVTTKNVAKGELITESHIKLTKVEKRRINAGHALNADAIIGGRAIRNLHRGFQVSAKDVCLVCKGDDVSIVAQSQNMMIKTSGTAIESGSFGESIKVMNNSSERIVKGTIGELRQVYVNL